MRCELFETAITEAIRFGPAARLLLTFSGTPDALHIHPLAYTRIGEDGFRIEIRISQYDDAEVVDDVFFLDAESVETVELQVKQKGTVWQDEPYQDYGQDEP